MRGILLTGLVALAIGVACAVCYAQMAAPTDQTRTVQPTQPDRLKPELVRRWEKMTPEQRQQMRERMKQWRAMTPEQQEKVRKNMERFHQLTPEQREKLMEARRKWDKVPPDMRRRMRQQFDRWHEMPLEARQRVMQHMTMAKDLLKSDFEKLKETPEGNRDAVHKVIHQKLRALMGLRGEQFNEFRKLSPADQATKLKELMKNLPPEGHQGHEGREMHGGPRRGLEGPAPETTNPKSTPAN